MTVEAIKDAIIYLSVPEIQELSEWIDELREDQWDRQMAEDFSPGGRGSFLLEQAKAEIDAGTTKPIEQLFAEFHSEHDDSRS